MAKTFREQSLNQPSNERERLMTENLIKGQNITAAARNAGYAERTARQMPNILNDMSRPLAQRVKKALDEARAIATQEAGTGLAEMIKEVDDFIEKFEKPTKGRRDANAIANLLQLKAKLLGLLDNKEAGAGTPFQININVEGGNNEAPPTVEIDGERVE